MQTEKAGITPKEKRLLIMAAVLGLFYLAFQFGFLPLYNEIREKTEQRDGLNAEWRTVETRLNSEAAVLSAYEEAKAAYREIEELFLRSDTDTGLSRMLTELVRNNGMADSNQALGNPVPFFIPGAENRPEGEESAFSTVTATMSLSGAYDSVKSLLAAVAADRDVSISRLSFSPRREGDGSEQVAVTFVVTMLNGLD
jgi:hypothetical protein